MKKPPTSKENFSKTLRKPGELLLETAFKNYKKCKETRGESRLLHSTVCIFLNGVDSTSNIL